MEREIKRWTTATFPRIRTAILPPQGSLTGDWAKVLATKATEEGSEGGVER